MAQDYSTELSPEVREKMKKNLVYVTLFSIVMLFAGLTSAYIVSMGDVFWVKYPLPLGFWISTTMIGLSSLFYVLALKFVKTRDLSKVRILMILTFLTGLGFAVFQLIGYRQLVDQGAHFRNSIMVVEGRYGDYFEIKYKGQFVEVNANDYLIAGKKMNAAQMSALKAFAKPFEKTANPKGYSINAIPSDFVLYYKNEPLTVQLGKLMKPSGETLQYVDMRRLMHLAWNIRDERGDFFHKGELGKDFNIFYKGKQLNYKDRTLMFGNKKLSAPLQNKINQSRDTSTSYLYIITVLHLLHILGALIYLIKMVRVSFSNTFSDANALSLKLGSIFWHFLGLLWLYLLLFLLFIH